MAITPKNPGAVDAPNTLTPDAAGSVAVPNSLGAGGESPNLALYSEQFDNSNWLKENSSISADAITAPNGTLAADKLEAGSTASISARVRSNTTAVVGEVRTISVYAKQAEARYIQIAFGGVDVLNDPRANFDLQDGIVTVSDADIQSANITAVGDGWYRIGATVIANATSFQSYFALIGSDSAPRLAGTPWTAGDGAYLWGAQIEVQPGATTYIKTEATIAAAGDLAVPNSLTPESAGSVAVPNSLTAESAGSVAVPNSLTAESAGSVAVPNSLTAESAGTVAVPNSLTAETAGAVAVPNSLTAQSAVTFPRTLTPTVSMNFADGLYEQAGQSIAESDLLTFSRASTATFVNRQLSATGSWEYFIDTAASGVMRIGYDAATGENLGVLIEGGRTNLCLYSEQLDGVSWVTAGSLAVGSNQSSSPDLTNSADKIYSALTASTTPSIIHNTITSTVSSAYTFSAFIKRSEASFIQISCGTGQVTGNPRVNYDLSNLSVGEQDLGINEARIEKIDNEWSRISATVTAASTSLAFNVTLIKSATDTRNQTNSWTAGEGLYLWGAQVEQGSTASSYIRTTTGAASRLADQLSIPVAGNMPSGDYSFNSEVSIADKDVSDTRFIFEVASTGGGGIQANVSTDGDFKIARGSALVVDAFSDLPNTFSVSGVFDLSSYSLSSYINGELQTTGSVLPVNYVNNSLIIGIGNSSPISSTGHLYGHIKHLKIYDEALTAAEVAQL